jgi:hypothetical protein
MASADRALVIVVGLPVLRPVAVSMSGEPAHPAGEPPRPDTWRWQRAITRGQLVDVYA